MNPEDRACFNCDYCKLYKVPLLKVSIPESDYWALSLCGNKLSDHYRHYLSLQHRCSWHSDEDYDKSAFPPPSKEEE